MVKKEFEMKAPSEYRELTDEEMETDGGWINFAIGLAATGVGIVANYAANRGLMKKKTATAVNVACTAVSIASGAGGIVQAAKGMASAGANAAKAVGNAAGFCADVGGVTYDSASMVGYATGKMC